MENTYCVYCHTSPSGKRYIGLTRCEPNKRWRNGYGYRGRTHFWKAIQKYGWDKFSHDVWLSGLSCENACLLERRYIAEYQTTNPLYGYNEQSGGTIGSTLCDAKRAELSNTLKRYYELHPEKRYEKSVRATGVHHTDETRQKMSLAKRGRTFQQTDSWKQHIGEANRAKIFSNKKLYDETVERCRANGLKSAMPVEQIDVDGTVIQSFRSATEAQHCTGAKNCNIVLCCRGKRKTANGYMWRFAT